MNLEYNFDNIVLLRDEMRSLRKAKHHTLTKDNYRYFQALYKADLIKLDQSKERDAFNRPIPLNTAHISDKGLRFLVWSRRQKMRSVLLPILISVITTVILYMLEHLLLPIVLSWF